MTYLYLFTFLISLSFVFYISYKINSRLESVFEAPGCLSGLCCILMVIFLILGVSALLYGGYLMLI